MGLSAWVVMSLLLAVGLLAGFLMHRSDFCMAGAFRDIFMFRSGKRFRALILMITVSAVLFETCRLAGFLPFYPFPWFAPPATVNFLGGMIFGLGMVLAGGCVFGVLYKMGGGSLLAFVAFIGLLFGSALYAEIHPWWIAVTKPAFFATTAVTVPQLLDFPPFVVVALLLAVAGFYCLHWYRAGLWRTRNQAEGFIPLWLSACGLAALGLVSVLVSGIPMGVTTTFAKMAALIESWFVPQHVAGLTFFSAQPLKYIVPLEGLERFGGAGPDFDVIAMLQLPLIVGVVLGAFLSAVLLGEFKLVRHLQKRQVLMVFSGGLIMAFGSRMTPGCNVWHLWGGLPLLTMQSLLFALGLFPGAWLGSKLLPLVLATGGSQTGKK